MSAKEITGNTLLFPVSEFRTPDTMDDETKILEDEQFIEANRLMSLNHVPKKDIAFVSLCTSTRPYNKSPKWATFIKEFGDRCDMIVSSNGGVIPMKYWQSYPFMTYDAGEHILDDLYKEVLYNRWNTFFRENRYKHILMNFKPHQRNYDPAMRVCKELLEDGMIESYVFLPDAEKYTEILENPHRRCFPDINPLSMEVLSEWITEKAGPKKVKGGLF